MMVIFFAFLYFFSSGNPEHENSGIQAKKHQLPGNFVPSPDPLVPLLSHIVIINTYTYATATMHINSPTPRKHSTKQTTTTLTWSQAVASWPLRFTADETI